MSSVKPLVVVQSRDLSIPQMVQFHKHFNNVVVINSFTKDKKVTDYTPNDVLFVDIRNQVGRDWFSANNKLLDAHLDNVVWCRASGQSVKKSDRDEFYDTIRYENKRLSEGPFSNRMELLHHLLSSTSTPIVQTRLKKLLKLLVKCVCGSSKD